MEIALMTEESWQSPPRMTRYGTRNKRRPYYVMILVKCRKDRQLLHSRATLLELKLKG